MMSSLRAQGGHAWTYASSTRDPVGLLASSTMALGGPAGGPLPWVGGILESVSFKTPGGVGVVAHLTHTAWTVASKTSGNK